MFVSLHDEDIHQKVNGRPTNMAKAFNGFGFIRARLRRKSDRWSSPHFRQCHRCHLSPDFSCQFPSPFRRTVFMRTTPCVRLRADFFLLGIVLRSKNILRKGIVSLGTVTSSRSANGGECKKKLMWYNAIREREWLFATPSERASHLTFSSSAFGGWKFIIDQPTSCFTSRWFYELKILLMQMNFWLKMFYFCRFAAERLRLSIIEVV